MGVQLLNLYNFAKSNNIDVYHFALGYKNAVCIIANEIKAIGISKHIRSEQIEKCVLAEELGHIQSRHTYFLNDCHNPLYLQNVSKAEHFTKRIGAEMLVPFDDLQIAIADSNTEIWQLAEYFDLPETTIIEAVNSYMQKGLIPLGHESEL